MAIVAGVATAACVVPVSHTTVLTLAATSDAISSSATPFSLALALSAGILTTLNPCGFALLPAYFAYVLHGSGNRQATISRHGGWQLLRSGLLGVPLAAGFLLIFLVAAGLLILAGHLVVSLFPWLALIVGTGLILLGGWILLTKRQVELFILGRLTTWLARRRWSGDGKRTGHGAQTSQQSQWGGTDQRARPVAPSTSLPSELVAAWGFGIGYGLSSLGCALPIFLLVVGNAITTADPGTVLLILAGYSVGITLVLVAVALAAAAFHDLLRTAIFPLLRWVQPVSALLMIAAGIYIIVYQLQAGFL
jgi:cytochrome c-type biogenesis protein